MVEFNKYLIDLNDELERMSGVHRALVELFSVKCYQFINDQFKKNISIQDCVINICLTELDLKVPSNHSEICVRFGLNLLLNPAEQNGLYAHYQSNFKEIFKKHESVFDAIPIFKERKKIFL